MTVGELKKWLDENEVPDDAIVVLSSVDSEGFESISESFFCQVATLGGGVDNNWMGRRDIPLDHKMLVIS